MQKIPTIFKRDYSHTYQVLNEPHPDCLWVFEGKGNMYRKYQGMAAMIMYGKYYKRHIIKRGQPASVSFLQMTVDPHSGKQFGWIPVDFKATQDKYYAEAYDHQLPDGTYELIGPKIHSNHEDVPYPILVSHKAEKIFKIKRDFKSLKYFLKYSGMEGVVFHHLDGRMAKIKQKDFGFTR